MALLPIAALGLSPAAHAKPNAPEVFCATYPEAPACAGGPVSCLLCHDNTSPASWNAYGLDLRAVLPTGGLSNEQFATELPDALLSIEGLDSDGDGFENLDEIIGGSWPADPQSVPGDATCPDDVSGLDYPICQYSHRHVFRKIHLDFCGRSPSYDDMQSFISLDVQAQTDMLHQTLDDCLDSEFWLGKNGVLWSMAHDKIRPVGSLKAGEDDPGGIPLADYYNDYQLYVWSQIDGNDARAVLTADFFVTRTVNNGATSYAVVQNLPDDPNCGACSEPMLIDRRNGNITTRWFLSYFIMFTPLPRAAAAQAYRAYLGYDIARSEGLFSVDGEPLDYDDKDVDGQACVFCHATLDPLSYAYRNYNGLNPWGTGLPRAQYTDQRLEVYEATSNGALDPFIAQTPEAGVLMGQPYNDLNDWTQIAANSDRFAYAAVRDYWRQLIGRDPLPAESAEYDQLWQGLKDTHNYSVEGMLHDFIMTEAYGAP